MSLDLEDLFDRFCKSYRKWQKANLDDMGFHAREVLWQEYVKVRDEYEFLRHSHPLASNQRIITQAEATA